MISRNLIYYYPYIQSFPSHQFLTFFPTQSNDVYYSFIKCVKFPFLCSIIILKILFGFNIIILVAVFILNVIIGFEWPAWTIGELFTCRIESDLLMKLSSIIHRMLILIYVPTICQTSLGLTTSSFCFLIS